MRLTLLNMCKWNAIVLCNNFSTVGIGAGQPSRLDSCKIGFKKQDIFSPIKVKSSVAASYDAFFHFPMELKL